MRPYLRLVASLPLLAGLLVPTPLSAVVNQVDGQVVPLSPNTPCPGNMVGCLQSGLNYGEGINPPGSPPTLPGPVDAVLDANTGPETFLVPTLSGQYNQVKFRLLQEGAGFENIFGWYNVGEPNKRFPVIFSCEGGNKSTYEPPTAGAGGVVSGGYEVTVDFQAEYLAGRYKGKQIGFYLISPEGSANRGAGGYVNNCATDPYDLGTLSSGGPVDDDNFAETSAPDDDNGFGRVYYTESKLNNDGNYVHYLIYQSKQNPQHFYFGFEDLFRGGDNDYEDTMVKVEGLVPTCQPQQEICNGVDDNCNGQIDENVFQACSTSCGPGQEQCQFTNDGNPQNDWINCTAQKPVPEVCNGLDDDCNGTADDGVPNGGACSVSGCTGVLKCIGGSMVCDAPSPTGEICDGKDNDCNGKIDDGVTRPCSTICGVGTETCSFTDDGDPLNDWINCTAQQPTTEVCNGKDDDCDGSIDNNIPATKCSIGPCEGQMQCIGAKMVCDAQTPSSEICDGNDNNCNGQVDENLIRPCLSKCGFGTETCQFTEDGDPTNDWVNCTAPQPQSEVCDGVDNDCDGVVDNNVPGEGEPCDHPQGNTCTQGKTKCVGGKITCVGATQATTEICDCKDNDCDGEIDEDNPCPPNTKCIKCGCRISCKTGEFGCPKGFACVEGYCIPDVCAGVTCKADEKCVAGQCISVCEGVTCKNGQVCQAGVCVEDNCYGKGCPAGQICIDNKCQQHPCDGVTCGKGQYCKDGKCAPSCGVITCGEGSRCVDGQCLDDPCFGNGCGNEVPCVDGQCDLKCRGVVCPRGQICRKGACIDDPCQVVRCYGGDEQCRDGQCISPRTYIGQRSEILATGAGGAACAYGGGGGAGLPLALLLLVGLAVYRGRRQLRSCGSRKTVGVAARPASAPLRGRR
jgi:hypothetical protein